MLPARSGANCLAFLSLFSLPKTWDDDDFNHRPPMSKDWVRKVAIQYYQDALPQETMEWSTFRLIRTVNELHRMGSTER